VELARGRVEVTHQARLRLRNGGAVDRGNVRHHGAGRRPRGHGVGGEGPTSDELDARPPGAGILPFVEIGAEERGDAGAPLAARCVAPVEAVAGVPRVTGAATRA